MMICRILLAAVMVAAAGCRENGRNDGTASAQPAAEASIEERTDSIQWKAVDEAMGRSGKMQPDGVYKYSLPRSDLRVAAAGVAVKPALALGSWVAFRSEGGKTVAMGDLVLTEREIAPVMSTLQEMGVEPTALHNHLLQESPSVMYLHIHGQGDPVKVARAVRAALARTATPGPAPGAEPPATSVDLDTARVAQALGYSGKATGGVYQVSIPRAEPVRVHGMTVPPSMGVATAINFQPTGRGKAAITGDFVLTAREVAPVLKALTAAGIHVTALHSHMLDEEPRLYFSHFWGNDDAVTLARGLRSALDRMNNQPRS
jgi:hypothetical protein